MHAAMLHAVAHGMHLNTGDLYVLAFTFAVLQSGSHRSVECSGRILLSAYIKWEVGLSSLLSYSNRKGWVDLVVAQTTLLLEDSLV